MIAATFFGLIFVTLVCLAADFAVMRRICQPACHSCTYFEQCLSRRICAHHPSDHPELCLRHWN